MAGGSAATYAAIPNNTAKQWWKDPCLRKNVFYSMGCMICPFYLGYDQSLLTGLQAIPQWNTYFHSPTGNWLGLIAATIFIPGIIFGFPADWICDRYGRRWAIYLGSFLIIAGGIFNGLSQNAGQFMGARAIIGAGGSITKVAAPALLQEAAHPRLRSPMGTMYYGFYYTGSLTSAIMCIIGLYIKGDWGWRLPCIFQIVGPIAVLSILITAPESPRYLVKKGRHEEALAMLAKFHANGDTDDQLVAWELKEITVALEQELIANKSSYVDFFKTRGNRKRFYVAMAITVGVNWVGNGIVSYYLSPVLKSVGVTKAVEITGINAGLAFWNLVIAMIAGLNVERFGRRPLFLISTAGMIISYAFVMGFSAGFATTGKSALGVAAIPFLFLFYGSYDIAWTPLNYSYVTEILPYNLRTKGLALYISGQNIANAFNQFVNPIALAAITWKYYAVYIAIDICYFILIYFYFPETKGLSMEEVSLVFDYSTKEGRKMAAQALERATHDAELAAEGYKGEKHGEERLESVPSIRS
ncbi:hypothetical protein EHS25_002575 [Saitozyma podzolica]|uniref:Major facilitator superfamily (MFS) profile domain-containing protein n=1 Tax=Saitozyma podzolica TaxID=1890683 RepID=A0A427YCX4_9TREE|nr:hypothetical protein EHS25_002575 [Saitozyma podzolica]